MTNVWDLAGYIASSRYRRAVCEHLLDNGAALPSDIADETDLAQPHVSRALSELRTEDIVSLLVPESQQKGRLYGLTTRGRTAIRRLVDGEDLPTVTVVDAAAFPYDRLLAFLRESCGAHLAFLAAYDGDVAEIRLLIPDESTRSDDETTRELVTTLWSDRVADACEFEGLPTGSWEFLVYGFEATTFVRIRVDDAEQVGIAFDRAFDESTRSFVAECREHLP